MLHMHISSRGVPKSYITMFDNINFELASEDEQDMGPIFSINQDDFDESKDEDGPSHLPLLALKNTVLFPGIVIPITVGRDRSLKAIQKAHEGDKFIGVLSQRDIEVEYPGREDVYEIGTVARILKLLKMPDGSSTAIIQGRRRFQLLEMTAEDPYMQGTISYQKMGESTNDMEHQALISTIKDKAERIIELSPNIPNEATMMLKNIKQESFLINFIASNLNAGVSTKQELLKENNPETKASNVLQYLDKELQLLELKSQIESKVRVDIEKQQRDYFLNQQLKTIQQELGQNPNDADIKKLIKRAEGKDWPEEVEKIFNRNIDKIKRVNPQIAEYSITMTYLETLLDLPWNEKSDDKIDLKYVQKVLDEDHFGLEKVKERIMEHLAVLKLKGDMKSPIICLVGPPGVGKTSLGKSVARALNREYVRMSLGGMHDESEIRGHRKTYIGAMPGRIVQSIKKIGKSNPVFMLDEIDKMGRDFRGDPASALLEVLDPEQNTTFYDNYLETEYDLSSILFIATSNSLNSIQKPLLDRMEIIRISGYSTEEKIEIAKRHLIKKQREAHGLKGQGIRMSKAAIEYLIENYTRESGVRNLDRALAKVLRKIAKKLAMEQTFKKTLGVDEVSELMGPSMRTPDLYDEAKVPGVAVGLAWTSTGGDILFIESSLSKGKGKLTLTGNLGDVMKESATTALSFVRAHSNKLGINNTMFEENDIHVHVPEGATPKDGPSAGITMLTTMASAYTGRKVKPFTALTGEITLRGKVLPVGGIKEKILAARRAGIKEVILCEDNRKHVAEINEDYIKGLDFIFVKNMQEVLDYVLV